MTFNLDIVSIESKLFSGEVSEVQIPSESGELSILPNHMAMVTILKKGKVTVKTEGGQEDYEIGKGVFSFSNNNASLLIESVLD